MWWTILWGLVGVTSAINVVRLPVSMEQDHTITINNTIEYILDFSPSVEQAMWPARLRVTAAGGDTQRPALVALRQPSGAQTFQLPYQMLSSSQTFFELQRTLCFNMTELESGAESGSFSVHISSLRESSVSLTTRAWPARDWLLTFRVPTRVQATLTAPSVRFYRWGEEQTSVRLVLQSPDEVCATVAVHNYTCPVAETEEAVRRGGMRMSMLRSGGAQIARYQYPHGFFVVVLVQPSDLPCLGEAAPPSDDWLWGAAAGLVGPNGTRDLSRRTKEVDISFQPSLTLAQYAVATSVTLVVFLLFYASFLGMVLAQRLPAFKRLVEPKAVLKKEETVADGGTESQQINGRTRRGSNVTLDSMDDNSESDEEHPQTTRGGVTYADTTTNGENGTDRTQPPPSNGAPTSPTDVESAPAPSPSPFSLPPQLTLAALSQRKDRTLRARSARYLSTLATVAVFYALPVLQFVIAFQLVLYVSGNLDLCYYNFLCAHPAGVISDFNHVFSNMGYLLLGALFMLQVRRRQRRRERKPRDEAYGIPPHYGLLTSLGAAMMVVALLSASYHVCPNRLNFQFDTAFMYVLAVLVMVKLYQARHPDINARAHVTFAVLAVIIALVVWGVLGGGSLFWGLFSVLHVFGFLLLSLRIYYLNQFRLDAAGVAMAARGVARGLPSSAPYRVRVILLLVANTANWGFAIFGLWTMPSDFAGHMLQVLLGNAFLYMASYLAMKLVAGEKVRWYAWCFTIAASVTWVPALYFFVSGSSSWSSTPAVSRHRNHECKALDFYDSHDFWHILSAVALYFSANALLTWDDGLAAVKRTEIAVF